MDESVWEPPDALAALAHDPYLEVFGRFWDGMSFLIASSASASDRLMGESLPVRFTMTSAHESLDRYTVDLRTGNAQWPPEFLIWQSYAFTIIEAHGLLDEYLRACFELFSLAKAVSSGLDLEDGWQIDSSEQVQAIEAKVRKESDRFGQALLWNRVTRLRSDFGLKARFGRPLTAALKHHREIRNGIVHGQLTPHIVMPDGTIGRMQAYPPPPYVPLGRHVVRGAISVMLAAHQQIDNAIVSRLGIEEDSLASAFTRHEIRGGQGEWFVDPWDPHPEHLFEPEVLRAWRPMT